MKFIGLASVLVLSAIALLAGGCGSSGSDQRQRRLGRLPGRA